MLCGFLAVESPETLGFAAVRKGFREVAMRQQLPMQTEKQETQYYRAPATWAHGNYLAYKGSSAAALRCRPPGAPASLDRPLDALLQTKPAAVLAFDLFARAGPKTSVAVDAARGDAHAAQTPARACTCNGAPPARALRAAASLRTAPLRGQPHKKHRARRRRIHLQLT